MAKDIGTGNYINHHFFPLNEVPISFPSISFDMIKYKEAKNQTFFGRSKQADEIAFRTKSKTVKVKELPPHPLKNQVPVGKYFLSEEISGDELSTGQSFTYNFHGAGRGQHIGHRQPHDR
jgi:hypothetical protein